MEIEVEDTVEEYYEFFTSPKRKLTQPQKKILNELLKAFG
jgi:hypothetical protein